MIKLVLHELSSCGAGGGGEQVQQEVLNKCIAS